MEGDFCIGASLGTTLTKLAIQYLFVKNANINRFTAESMLVLTSIMHLGTCGLPAKLITKDNLDRLAFCLKVLSDKSSLLHQVFSADCRDALRQMLEAQVGLEDF